jgi:hypothetical protein
MPGDSQSNEEQSDRKAGEYVCLKKTHIQGRM